jgi:hypothetical protein
VSFSSIRHIPVYLASDLTTPIAAGAMVKVRLLIEKHGAKMQSINGRSGVIIDTADILKGYLGSHLQFLTPNEAGNPGAAPADHPPAPSHQAMNDREVMEHLARAANLTADVQGGLDERTIAEIREIKQRLSDAIPGMTYPRPITGPVASKLNQMLQIFTQAQAGKKLTDVGVIRQVQALTW